jgi:Aerobic-type carbon monoxide dehydrogenase, middle subunit CoxM/CutM homologs
VDLNTVTAYRAARSRDDLVLADGETILGGGTWLYSEPQVATSGLVDLTTMGWPAWERTAAGLTVAATCTIAELTRIPEAPGWRAQPLFFQAATALLASFKVWNIATVGGNVCRSFAAASMVSLCVALDAEALVWTPDGGEYRVAVADLITGNGTNTLARGDVLRALEFPERALRARAGFRKIALAELGRSGAVVTGRVDEDGQSVFTVTAAVLRPAVLRYDVLPDAEALRSDVAALEGYYTDPLGAADWRRQVSAVLAEQIRQELSS